MVYRATVVGLTICIVLLFLIREQSSSLYHLSMVHSHECVVLLIGLSLRFLISRVAL
jgi:hypothetical protein